MVRESEAAGTRKSSVKTVICRSGYVVRVPAWAHWDGSIAGD